MTKTNQASPQDDTAVVTAPAAAEITLTEFCTRLSETVRRPELIAGFEYTEKKAGNLKGTSEAFQARFDAFVKKPV